MGFRKSEETSKSERTHMKILVVEDEPALREFMLIVLGDLGHEIVEAENGSHALEQLSTGLKVDLIITDHDMPKLSGRELVQNLQLRGSETPVIVMSGLMTVDREEELSSFGVKRLAKPFNVTELMGVVKEAVQSLAA
jgi:CheY-like chemotaxis protein